MKVVVQEREGEGLEAFLGKRVTLFCGVYIYTGTMVGLNDNSVKLTEAKIVYETGELSSGSWKDAQSIPKDWYVMIQSIESFGDMK